MSVIAVETVSYDNHVRVPSGKSEIRNAMAVEDTRKLHFGWRPALGVKGSRVYLQTKGSDKPSKIPRALHALEDIPQTSDNLEIDVHTTLPPTSKDIALHYNKQQQTTKMSVILMKTQTLSKHKDPLGTDSKRCVVRASGKKVMDRGQQGFQSVVKKPKTKSGIGGSGGIHIKVGCVKVQGGVVQRQRGNRTAGKKALEKLIRERNRQMFLSHKYSAVWCRKVFGRVLPSTARRYHCRKLQRKSFRVWCHQWWSVRREWKLNIRAECHNRYRLWILVWKNWTQFVAIQRQRKAVKKSATCHNEKRLMIRVWKSWCEYKRERRMKKASWETAMRWHLARVLRNGWLRWRQSLQTKRENNIMSATAVHHWAITLQRQVWIHWVIEYRERMMLKHNSAVAKQHWAIRQEAACWGAWWVYVEHRRRRRNMNRVASERCCMSLLDKHFNIWQERLQWNRQVADFQQLVIDRGVIATKRRSLAKWRHYMELAFYGQHLYYIATSHYHTILKFRALTCLRMYSKRQQLQAAHKTVAQRFCALKMLEHSWCVWLQRCDHCEEIKMLPLTRKARHHYRKCALKKLFPGWKAFVVLRRHQKAQITLADQHFKSNALPKYFAVLQNYSVIRCYKREMNSQAQSFRQENLLSMVFYKWWRTYQLSQNIHTLERVAILHNEDMVKRVYLKLWRELNRIRIQQLSREDCAIVHHERRLLSVALYKWRDHLQSRVVAVRQTANALQKYTHKSMRKVWGSWRKYVEVRRKSNARYAQGIQHYHRALLHRVWSGWQIYHFQAMKKKDKMIRAQQFYSVILEKHVLQQWRDNVEHQQLQRHLTSIAIKHFVKTAYHKYFMVWRERTVKNLEIAQRECERVQEVASVLRQGKLSRVVWCWREYTSSNVARRIGYERAIVHSHHHLLRHCFTAWYRYHQLALRKMLLKRQCAHFERSRLVSTFYAKWRIELMKAVVEKQKSLQALWHWSQSLQRKALVCWLLYVINRKRKAERYAQALQRHRSRLLHIGVTQWIKFATNMESKRLEAALEQQTQVAERTMKCVRRCVQIWKSAVRSGRGKQGTKTEKASTVGEKPEALREITEDIWSSIARKYQIPHVPVRQRPQPRHSNYLNSLSRDVLSHPLNSDFIPRCHIPHPLTPPVLCTQHQQPHRPRHNKEPLSEEIYTTQSFAFLPSTSNESLTQELPTTTNHTHHHPSPLLPNLLPNTPCYNATMKTRPAMQLASQTATQPVVLLPPSAFERSSSKTEAPQLPLSTECSALEQPAVARLNDPAVRSHIVHVRDKLRIYHEMRAKCTALEQQVACADKNNDDDHLHQLQEELSRTADQLHRTEPYLLEMVAQIQKLLAKNQNQ